MAVAKRRGFTLVELLVVIAVVALLLGILLPALSGARQRAKAVACLSGLRQIGLASQAYAMENGDRLPRSRHSALSVGQLPWGRALVSQLDVGGDGAWAALFNGLYRCASDPRRELTQWSYAQSVYPELTAGETKLTPAGGAVWPRRSMIERPSATVLYADYAGAASTDHVMAHFWYVGAASDDVAKVRHLGRANYAMVDGHAETLAFAQTFDRAGAVDRWNPHTAQ